jgi:hypothetical protein
MTERWHQAEAEVWPVPHRLVEADINAGFEPILLEFLMKRARLY